MKKLGVIGNCTKTGVPEALRRVSTRAKELGIVLCADEPTAPYLDHCPAMPAGLIAAEVEAVMALGGDGTMLRVAREIADRDKPLIGIKLGGLGFLTSVAENEIDQAMACLASNNFTVSERSVAECTVGRSPEIFRALNDLVINTGKSLRVATLSVSVDGDHVTSYVCDGLILSTPTGSTGHSLSAGGPIVQPDASVFVINLICAHSLSARPLVVPDSSLIEVTVQKCAEELTIAVDGQISRPLALGDVVRLRRGARNVKFIHLPGYSYFNVLRQKLNWSGSSVKETP